MTPPPAAVHEDPPPVQAFAQAAQHGRRIWVQRGPAGLEVHGGSRRPATCADDPPARTLFASALRARYGAQAAGVALRDLFSGPAPHAGALDASRVRAAIERAESLQALVDAQAHLWRLEFSAALLGRRFVALCERCGIDAHALPLARRDAIDTAMGWPLPTELDAAEDAPTLAARLQTLLLQALH